MIDIILRVDEVEGIMIATGIGITCSMDRECKMPKQLYYAILEGDTVIPITDGDMWAEWFQGTNRRVAYTEDDDWEVITSFLGLNHQFGDGPPLWFETMVFGGKLNEEQARYTTIEEARAGHERMVARVREAT